MAVVKMKTDGTFGVCELNLVESVRTGAIKSQYSLNSTAFASIDCENGMLLVVDDIAKEITVPTNSDSYTYLVNFEAKDYENKGRQYCKITLTDDFLPRLYKLHKGDIFEVDQFQFLEADYANWAAIQAALTAGTAVYGTPDATGYIYVKPAAKLSGTETVKLQAVESVTLPNGNTGLKFAVLVA